jgi:hypothetical protein
MDTNLTSQDVGMPTPLLENLAGILLVATTLLVAALPSRSDRFVQEVPAHKLAHTILRWLAQMTNRMDVSISKEISRFCSSTMRQAT